MKNKHSVNPYWTQLCVGTKALRHRGTKINYQAQSGKGTEAHRHKVKSIKDYVPMGLILGLHL